MKEYERRRAKHRRNPYSKLYLLAVAIATLTFCMIAIFCRAGNADEAVISPDSCLEKVIVPDELPEIIVPYTGFTVSFNPAHHQPNYVVWELTRSETTGDIPRYSKFAADNDVYGSASLNDYRNSGFDRGHMAPAADMKWSEQAMKDCHYLTNICPQDHSINGGQWSTLEKKCRQWADRDSAIVIICGPVLTDELSTTIGRDVSVPRRFFKVVLSPYTNPPAAIAFIMPNTPSPDGLESFATSVDNVEAITGFDFFSCLPDDIEAELESTANFQYFNRRK